MRFMILAFWLLLTPLSYAQDGKSQPATEAPSEAIINQYDPKYRRVPLPEIVKVDPADVLPNNDYSIFFVREPGLKPGEVILRLSSPVSVAGCIDTKNLEIEQEEEPPYMRVTIKNVGMELNDAPRYDTIPCSDSGEFLYVDIHLDRDHLIQKKITQLVLRGDAAVDTYNIEVSPEKIILSSSNAQSFKAQHLAGKGNALEHWFYPENVVVLSAPAAKDTAEAYSRIKTLANKNNLIVLSSSLKGFEQNLQDGETKFYFADEAGAVRQMIGDKTSVPFGTIEIPRTYTGVQGPYQAVETVNVFAQKPGYYD